MIFENYTSRISCLAWPWQFLYISKFTAHYSFCTSLHMHKNSKLLNNLHISARYYCFKIWRARRELKKKQEQHWIALSYWDSSSTTFVRVTLDTNQEHHFTTILFWKAIGLFVHIGQKVISKTYHNWNQESLTGYHKFAKVKRKKISRQLYVTAIQNVTFFPTSHRITLFTNNNGEANRFYIFLSSQMSCSSKTGPLNYALEFIFRVAWPTCPLIRAYKIETSVTNAETQDDAESSTTLTWAQPKLTTIQTTSHQYILSTDFPVTRSHNTGQRSIFAYGFVNKTRGKLLKKASRLQP